MMSGRRYPMGPGGANRSSTTMRRFDRRLLPAIALIMLLARRAVWSQELALPAPGVIATWEEAGAEFGWITLDPAEREHWRFDTERSAPDALPAFRFRVFPRGVL